MKRLFFIATMMLGAAFFAPSNVYAQDEVAAETETTEEKAVTVPGMLAKVEYVTKAKPKKKVSVYFILRSHSKCGFCRKIVPDMNEHYKAMKGKGAELIMLSGDSELKVAKKWAKEAEMTYPIVTNATAGKVQVPSGGSGGTPNIVAVTTDGTVIKGVSGASACTELVASWKELVKEAKAEQKNKKAAAKKAKNAKKKAQQAEDAAESAAETLSLD